MIDLNNLNDCGINIDGADPQTLFGFGYGGSPGDFNGDGANGTLAAERDSPTLRVTLTSIAAAQLDANGFIFG